MDEYEPITDELRSYIRKATSTTDTCWWTATDTQSVRDLCDAIDAVHAQLERDYDRLKAERDSMAAALDAAQGEHAYAPESHYMMLPKDADGVPIHVGDVMEGVDKYDSLKKVMGKVITVSFESDGTTEVAIQAWNSDGKSWHRAYLDPNASVYHHYHATTVDDVLTEFAAKLIERGGLTNGAAQTIADFAAKLCLADGKE